MSVPRQSYPRCLPAGESAIVVELGDAIAEELNARVLRLDALVNAKPFAGFAEAIPTYRSLLVVVDPESVDFDQAESYLLELARKSSRASGPANKRHVIPVVYDGPDLDELADRIGETRENVISLHSDPEYVVYMVGFVPGFGYMGPTVSELGLPRRSSPRVRVPAGSVAIAMGQTGIYPFSSPGGWHLLGRADPEPLFRPRQVPPALLAPGDRVRFEPAKSLPPSVSSDVPSGENPPGRAVFCVDEPGLFTTVQDRGRFGAQRFGVPVAGAMDDAAMTLANRLVGNAPGEATLELTLSGPQLQCLAPVVCSITGADLEARVERSDLGVWPVSPGRAFLLRPGNRLVFGELKSGARSYVAIKGGFCVPRVLGSCATYVMAGLGGLQGRPLQAGDTLHGGDNTSLSFPGGFSAASSRMSPVGMEEIRIVWGPQDEYFAEDAQAHFVGQTYRVSSQSDRMGYRLEGEPLSHRGRAEIVSDGMFLGAIQIPPSGQPIVMMADRATTGGYPKIATVARVDLSALAQIPPGGAVRFRAISRQQAQRLYNERHRG